MDKASNESISKKYLEYKQCELNEKGEKTAKVLGKHATNLYCKGICWWVKIKDVNKLCKNNEDDPIIKDQTAGLGCLLVFIFGDYLVLVLASVLIATHTWNNVDSGDEPENKNEGYESD